MVTLLYDGSFDGFLCAVFDTYYYRYTDVDIQCSSKGSSNLFGTTKHANNNPEHSARVFDGLQKKLSHEACMEMYRAFLSGLDGIENTVLEYIRHIFNHSNDVTTDYGNKAVLTIQQTSKKVWREKHRMEAFVRFQKTADNLYFAIIEPDYNVLPLIADHFKNRYADQNWLIYDTKRKYGIFYDGNSVEEVSISFSATSMQGKNIEQVYDAEELKFKKLWQQYFKSVNIAARKNTKLHLQHMPRRYWKYLTEKHIQ
jgi:probable DNA metabolism protein